MPAHIFQNAARFLSCFVSNMNKQDYIAPKRAVAMADSGAGVPWQELQRWSERQDEGNTEGHHGRGTNSKRAHRRLDFEHVEPGMVVCACMLIVPLFCPSLRLYLRTRPDLIYVQRNTKIACINIIKSNNVKAQQSLQSFHRRVQRSQGMTLMHNTCTRVHATHTHTHTHTLMHYIPTAHANTHVHTKHTDARIRVAFDQDRPAAKTKVLQAAACSRLMAKRSLPERSWSRYAPVTVEWKSKIRSTCVILS